MILISRVVVEGFRSFLADELPKLGHLTVLVGKNSTGKSNVLRALNLFFNNEAQPGQAISFSRDLFDQSRQRRKKRVSITVDFTLPQTFLLRKKLEHLETLGSQFSITRIWELDSQFRIVDRYEVSTSGKNVPDAGSMAQQFLALTKFRYIPNQAVPTDILRDESQALARFVFLRMKDQSHANRLMEELTSAASRMLKEASSSMELTSSPLKDPTVTISTLIQMLSMTGFQARGSHGGVVQDAEWGAGHQAFFLYHVLRTIDTDYSRFFGWRQATIWAVEEPESALHHDLETALASEFRRWTRDSKYRLQIILTTHSPIFTMAADVGSWVDIEKSSTSLRMMPIQQLVRASETQGVSTWIHPILSHPWNPVILVEGPDDADALTYVASIAGFDFLRFVALPLLDLTEPSGGKDSIINYLKRHQSLIPNRQREAPLLVLFDWDVSQSDLGKATNAYGRNGADHILKMDPRHCDPLLGTDFKGIERFYPPKIILEAHNSQELVLGIASGRPYSISRTQLLSAKRHLLRRLKVVTDPGELKPLERVVQDVERSIAAILVPQRSLFQG